MKLPFRLYEAAGDGGSGGGGSGGAGDGGGASGAGASSGAGTLLSSSGAFSGGQGQGGGGTGGGQQTQQAQGSGAGSASPFFVGLYDSTGKIDKAKLDALPAHLKPYKDTFAKYDTADALFTGMGNLIQLAGKKGLEPLPADAPAEAKAERAALMRKLNNVPEKPDGYGLKKPDGMPDEQWNGEYVNSMAAIMHKHNISPEAVQELMAADMKFAEGMRAKSDAAIEQTFAKEQQALKEAFGSDYAKKVDMAVRAAKTLGLDVNDPIFRNSKVVVAMSKVAEMVSEDRMVSGESNANLGQSDRTKALDIVNNQSNPLHKAYHDSNHPQHAQALEQVATFNRRYHEAQKARK